MKSPVIWYGGFYFFSVSLFAFIQGFFPLHLKAIGLSAAEIAIISTASTIAAIISPPIVLSAVDRGRSARRLLLLTSWLSLLLFSPIITLTSSLGILLFWTACLILKRAGDAVVDAHAISVLDGAALRFEHVRVWGSLGYIAVIAISGVLVDEFGLGIIPLSGATLLGLRAIICLFSKEDLKQKESPKKSLNFSVREIVSGQPRSFWILCTATSLVWASHMPLYLYLSVHLEQLGASAKTISLAWNIGVLAEIAIFFFFPLLKSRFSFFGLLTTSALLSIVRWLVLAISSNVEIVLISQVLHSFSFGVFYLCSLKLARELANPERQQTAQGLLQSIGMGLGSLTGQLLCAWLSEQTGYENIAEVFWLAVLLNAVALVVLSIRSLRRAAGEQ